MSIGSNVYLTGLGGKGTHTAAADTYLRIFIEGKPGNTLVIDQIHFVGKDSQSTQEYIKIMRPLARTQVTAAATAAGTSGFTISTASLAFGDSRKWNEATDTLAANDIVAIELSDGTWEWDEVNNVSTVSYITLDTALTGKPAIGDNVYIFGTAANAGHQEIEIPAAGTYEVKYNAARTDKKGDPLMVMNYPASSTGTLADGVSVYNVQYSYVNK